MSSFLIQAKFNDSLMGILRVRELESPPYVDATPFVTSHKVSPQDRFAVLGSDGLFDFFTNEEVVDFVWRFVQEHPGGDPARFMLEQLLLRAAESAGKPSAIPCSVSGDASMSYSQTNAACFLQP